MLPPIDDSILQGNPKFAALHTQLTNSFLNPNGSTKHHPTQKERDAVSSTLKACQIRTSKSDLIISALRNLDTSGHTSKSTKQQPQQQQQQQKQLPTALLELILLLTSRLSSTHIPQSQTKLLETTTQWQSLPTHLPQIAALASAHLQTQALALSRILSPSTNASFLHRTIPKLHSSITSLQSSIIQKKAELHKARSVLTTEVVKVLQAYQTATSLTIQILETSKHGSLSLKRHYQTKITYLAQLVERVRLEAMEKKGKGERMVYTDEVRGALGEYVRHLRDGRERLRERRKGAERVLWGYGVGREEEGDGAGKGKERVMREVAKVYGELMREVGEVGRDVERLRGRR